VHRTKPQHRCFTHATIQHPVLVQPVIWLYQSDSQNLEFIADSEALLKISDKKYQITLLKKTAHELRCLIQSFYQSLIKTNHHVKQKQSKKINLWKYALVVPALAFLCCFK
jgi:hypothetical protein